MSSVCKKCRPDDGGARSGYFYRYMESTPGERCEAAAKNLIDAECASCCGAASGY